MAAHITRNDWGGSVMVDETYVVWNDSEEVECEEDEDTDWEIKTVTW
jgi:hypothetical protein